VRSRNVLRRSVSLVLIALLAAGCLASQSEPQPEAPVDPRALPFPDPMGQDHDHADPKLHAHAYQFTQTDFQPLAGGNGKSANVHALDVKAGYLFAAVYGNEADAEGGFFIFDVKDPEKPVQVGRFQFPGPLGGDRSMEATEDAEYVVLGTELVDCAGHVNPFAPGLYLVDVRDKANPKIAAYEPDDGVHSVAVHRIDGVDYVFTLASQANNVFRIDKGGPVARLVRIADTTIGHDSLVMDDPLIGKPLLYAANGAGGFTISDVSDPADPQQVAEWNIPNREDGKYYIHTGAVSIIDGRRIAVVTTEDWEDYPSALWVLDATDLGLIETVSSWSAPGNHPAENAKYSMHNPRFHGSTLVLSYYHGGVWALDLSTPEKRANPPIVGQFMPAEDLGHRPAPPRTYAATDGHLCPHLTFDLVPLAFDVESGDGVVYVADLHTGLYTLRPEWG
jgi:hypothetical protein